MKLFRLILSDLKQNITSKGFSGCLLLTALLCFTANLYYDSSAKNQYSVIQCIFEFDRDFMLKDITFCAENIIAGFVQGFFTMFVPILSAFVFIPVFSEERQSKYIRYSIFRMSKNTYYCGKFLSSVLSSGIAITAGFILFSSLVYILFPHFDEYPDYLQNMAAIYFCSGVFGGVLLKFLSVFIFGMLYAVPSLMFFSMIKNRYLIICIPFFLKYALTQTITKINLNEALSPQPNNDLLNICGIIFPDNLLTVFYYGNLAGVLIYSAIIFVLGFILYFVFMRRRTDCGC